MVNVMKQRTLHGREKSRHRLAYGIVLFSFVLGIFGIGSGWGMQMDQNGGMRDCVFMRGGAHGLCPMQMSDHVTDWRRLFGYAPQTELFIIVFTVMFGIAVVAWLTLFSTPLLLRFLWYERAKVHQRFFAPLRFAFARGIVQPKIYA